MAGVDQDRPILRVQRHRMHLARTRDGRCGAAVPQLQDVVLQHMQQILLAGGDEQITRRLHVGNCGVASLQDPLEVPSQGAEGGQQGIALLQVEMFGGVVGPTLAAKLPRPLAPAADVPPVLVRRAERQQGHWDQPREGPEEVQVQRRQRGDGEQKEAWGEPPGVQRVGLHRREEPPGLRNGVPGAEDLGQPAPQELLPVIPGGRSPVVPFLDHLWPEGDVAIKHGGQAGGQTILLARHALQPMLTAQVAA